MSKLCKQDSHGLHGFTFNGVTNQNICSNNKKLICQTALCVYKDTVYKR